MVSLKDKSNNSVYIRGSDVIRTKDVKEKVLEFEEHLESDKFSRDELKVLYKVIFGDFKK